MGINYLSLNWWVYQINEPSTGIILVPFRRPATKGSNWGVLRMWPPRSGDVWCDTTYQPTETIGFPFNKVENATLISGGGSFEWG